MKKTLEFYPPRVGQIWQNKQRKSDRVFLITKIWEKTYPAKGKQPSNARARVTGVVSGGNDQVSFDCDIDVGSLANRYPFLLWNPPPELDDLDELSTPQ